MRYTNIYQIEREEVDNKDNGKEAKYKCKIL